MKEIPLTQGHKALVDDEDYEMLAQNRWCYTSGYAARRMPKSKTNVHVYMHRLLCPAEANMLVIHRDGNRLNNQRDNLVVRTRTHLSQSAATRAVSGLKGVHFRNGKWVAQICINRKNKHLGRFIDKIEAARAYDAVARELYGDCAHVNFGPDSPHFVRPQEPQANAV